MISILLQYLAPQHLLSRLMGKIANCRWVWFKNWMIQRFIRIYHVNLAEAASENLADYPNFNSFFTRHLKKGARQIIQTPQSAACPADGFISQLGPIEGETLLQAKNFKFSLHSLLGAQAHLTALFQNGSFATIYLAPRDYHRVHIPVSGILCETFYIPGKLFSVNQHTADHVPNLFARNERLVCYFKTEFGPMAVILVGAMIVGSINTSWTSTLTPGKLHSQVFPEQGVGSVHLQKGDEVGYFKMGSTVIVLFPKNCITWGPIIQPHQHVQLGQLLGTYQNNLPPL